MSELPFALSIVTAGFLNGLGTPLLWRSKEPWAKPLAVAFWCLTMWVAIISSLVFKAAGAA